MKGPLVALLALVVVGGAAGVAYLVLSEDPKPPVVPSGWTRERPKGRAGDPVESPPPEAPPAPTEGDEPVPPPDVRLPNVPIPGVEGDPVPGAGLRFPLAPFAAACANVDWKRVGIGCRQAQKHLAEIARSIARGGAEGTAAGATAGEAFVLATRDATPLLTEALPLTEDARGGGMAMVLSFPAWEANAIAATLDAWKLPLTDAQADELKPAWETHAAAWSGARGAGPEGWTLEALVAVTRSRVKVQETLDRVLSAEQRAALWPQPVAGRVGLDLFSAASVWRDRIDLAFVRPDQDAVTEYSLAVGRQFQLDEADPDVLVDRVGRWFRARDEKFRQGVKGSLSRARWVTLDELLPAVLAWPELVTTLRDAGAFQGPPELVADRQFATRRIVLPAFVTR